MVIKKLAGILAILYISAITSNSSCIILHKVNITEPSVPWLAILP